MESFTRKSWKRFSKNRLALLGLIILLFFVFLAVFAPYLTKHDPNRANLRVRNQPPSYMAGVFR